MPVSTATALRTEEFEATALMHRNSLYKLALSMTKNESDAQDLVQETYLKAYRFFDKFEPGTNCKAWLITILRNTFINTTRRSEKAMKIIHLSELEEHGVELPANDSLENEIFGELLDDDITAAVNALPAGYRTPILLADIRGLSYREIADIIDRPIGTVMSRLHRGRKLLKESLNDYARRYGYAGKRNLEIRKPLFERPCTAISQEI